MGCETAFPTRLDTKPEALLGCKLAEARLADRRLLDGNLTAAVIGLDPAPAYAAVIAPYGAEHYLFQTR